MAGLFVEKLHVELQMIVKANLDPTSFCYLLKAMPPALLQAYMLCFESVTKSIVDEF